MSTLASTAITCPLCGDVRARDIAIGLHGEDLHALRGAIMDGSFQRFMCEACHFAFRVEAPATYLDLARGIFILCFAATDEARWSELEGEVLHLYEDNVVRAAPPFVKDLVGPQWLRAAFGLAALREKLVIAEHGLDDRVVEALKLELIRAHEIVLDPQRRPRLREVEGDVLVFDTWEGSALPVPREAYDHVARSDSHRALIDLIGAGPYVDLGRLMLGRDSSPS